MANFEEVYGANPPVQKPAANSYQTPRRPRTVPTSSSAPTAPTSTPTPQYPKFTFPLQDTHHHQPHMEAANAASSQSFQQWVPVSAPASDQLRQPHALPPKSTLWELFH